VKIRPRYQNIANIWCLERGDIGFFLANYFPAQKAVFGRPCNGLGARTRRQIAAGKV
jgi:hypothetical protein